MNFTIAYKTDDAPAPMYKIIAGAKNEWNARYLFYKIILKRCQNPEYFQILNVRRT
jgi:hypothetical protein